MTELPALTKLDVAQREINAAVNMTFAGGDPVAICVLASAARAIVGALCEIADASSFKKELQDFQPEMSDRAYYKAANKAWNFFKHADQDPEDVLEGFKPDDADSILFTAVFDFGALCQGKSIEAQVADRNTQDYDLLIGQRGSRNFKPVQVKSVRASPWLLSRASLFGALRVLPTVYVLVGDEQAKKPVRYFIAKGDEISAHAKAPASWRNHTSINLKALEPFENRWDSIREYAEHLTPTSAAN